MAATTKKTPSAGEIAATLGVMSTLRFMPYNPDDLVRSKGGIKIYQEMTREPYIKAALMQKKTRLLNVGWDILPASKNPLDIEIAAFVKWNLDTYLAGAFTRDLYEILDAMDSGYSISEKVWGTMDSGKWKGKVVLQNIKSKDPIYFDFKIDEFGNLLDKGVWMKPRGGAWVDLPANKFVIFPYLMRYENLYGNSDLRAAYRAFWIKDTAWKLRAVYMERYSGNNLKGTYPRNDTKAKEELIKIFKTWQQETGIALPEGVDVQVMNLATSAKSEYEASIVDCNHEMQIGILGQTLTMDVGKGGTGSRALGKVHDGVIDDFVLFLDEVMAAEVNLQIIRPLVDYNYEVDDYPKWRFKSRETFDEEAFSRTLRNLAALDNMEVPVKWAKEKFRIPDVEAGEPVLKMVKQPSSSNAPQPPLNPRGGENVPVKMAEDPGAGTAPLQKKENVGANGDSPYFRPLNKFELFAELPRIDKETAELVSQAKDASAPIYTAIKDDILSQVERKKVIENGDYAGIEKITVNVGDLKKLLADTMLKANIMGRADIRKEYKAVSSEAPAKMAEDYVPDEALNALAIKAGMSKEEFDALVAEEKAQAFTVAGLEKTQIETDMKQLLIQSIKSGDDFNAFKFRLSEAFIKYSMPVYGGVGEAGDSILDYHAEVVFRTNVMDAYNQGRKESLLDPAVKEVFPAWQYSAVMDGRTRPSHAAMDGQVFMADDPIWGRITPPCGYNCRCVLIPVNKYDFTRDMLSPVKDIPKTFPDAGF